MAQRIPIPRSLPAVDLNLVDEQAPDVLAERLEQPALEVQRRLVASHDELRQDANSPEYHKPPKNTSGTFHDLTPFKPYHFSNRPSLSRPITSGNLPCPEFVDRIRAQIQVATAPPRADLTDLAIERKPCIDNGLRNRLAAWHGLDHLRGAERKPRELRSRGPGKAWRSALHRLEVLEGLQAVAAVVD